ncbi:MAG: discoidin domain-containing protein, partial [Bacteroidota bacterium]
NLAPKVPTGLKVDDFGNSDFSVSWDSSSTAKSYIVQIQDSLIWKTIDSTQELSYTYTNLEGRSRYRARIAAKNDFGVSAFSDYVFALTTANNDIIISNENWSLKFVDSEEKVGEDGAALNAFDGDENTFWHTEWYNNEPIHPHEIQIDLGANCKIKGFKYLPRQDGGINGTIADYEFYVSADDTNWGNSVSNGTFDPNTELKEIYFDEVEGRFIKMTATSEINGGPWTSMAELILVGEIIVGIGSDAPQIPDKFELYQNYPNPFNPTTTINYTLPETSIVTISIYNSIGKLVNTIVNKSMQAGYHSVRFDASEYASGIYFYRLKTQKFSKTNKMILLK